ncbi:proteasome subunit beta [Candidatus Woesearchaeota archaeon]|nr:proteasome subunit beta [Candidatus Woesearchaeota archaeon]
MSEMESRLNTGTTTVAIKCKDGIILAADKRATAGNFIANKSVDKIYEVADGMALTTAGTVSDVQLLLKLIRAELRLKKLRTGRLANAKEAANLLAGMVYANIRKMSMIPGISHFLFAGHDNTGFHVYDIYPDGSLAELDDFVASGSGSVFAYGVLETLYKPEITIDDGKELALKSVNAALNRDSASGNGIDIAVITAKGFEKVLTKMVESRV